MVRLAKKTIELDIDSIIKLREYFNTNTDKEAVNLALQLVAGEKDIIDAHLELAATCDLNSPYS